MNFNQLENLTTRTLKKMGCHSDEAVMASMMIVAHESSGGEYLRQVGGPALGIIQMELETYDTVWDFGASTLRCAKRLGQSRNFKQLEWNLVHNIFMARARLLMDVSPLPTTSMAMSLYLKSYYNTYKGKAKQTDYINAYNRWKA